MFAFVHLAYDKGWRSVGNTIAIYTNPFSEQQEQRNIISLIDSISEMSLTQCKDIVDLISGIRNKNYEIKIKNIIPLVDDLEI